MNRRTMTKTLLAAFASGTLVSRNAAAQTPEAASAITLVDVPGVALALSPDGTMVAGVADREVLCVWDVESFEPIAQSKPLPELGIIDDASVVWSPDNSAVAWSLQAARLLRDSDIYVFDIASATITNLTGEGGHEDAASLLEVQATPGAVLDVDTFPGWSADGSDILFARSPWGGDTPRESRLMRIPRDGGEASEVALLSDANVLLVSGPLFPFDDGSVLYGTWPPQPDSPEQGVFMVTPDGEVESISSGMLASDTPAMMLTSAAPHARKASAVSLQNLGQFTPDKPIWIELDLDTGIGTPFEEVLSLPESGDAYPLVAAPAFLTGADGMLTGYGYATRGEDSGTYDLWTRALESDGPDRLGTVEDIGSRGEGILQVPRVVAVDAGTIGFLFLGNLWIANIG